ncbi:MAG: SUMF1/EgtB/PvdO family nonheme iron enzyme [Methylomonas sp.]|jgi:formylglycine-generating enzyme required for sulfatase activity
MVLGRKSWRNAGITRIALAGALIVAVYFISDSLSAKPRATLLGTPEQCSRFSGLPSNWGRDKHAGMAYIPAGDFIMGTTLGYEEERQELRTKAQGFWIDQTEVTVAQFAAFAAATGYVTEAEREGGGVVFHNPSAEELNQRPYAWWTYVKGANWRRPTQDGSAPKDNQPATLITFKDALAYAQWLGRDLPTEAEWEYAAKAGHNGADLEKEPRDKQGKPQANFWQGRFPTQNIPEDGYTGLAPVGCFTANDFNLYDMVGNAWEQTKDIYTPAHETSPQPAFPGSAVNVARPDQAMVVKGGSHLCGRNFCVRYRPSAREAHEANLPIAHIGFRTVMRDNSSNRLPELSAW